MSPRYRASRCDRRWLSVCRHERDLDSREDEPDTMLRYANRASLKWRRANEHRHADLRPLPDADAPAYHRRSNVTSAPTPDRSDREPVR